MGGYRQVLFRHCVVSRHRARTGAMCFEEMGIFNIYQTLSLGERIFFVYATCILGGPKKTYIIMNAVLLNEA